MRQKSINRILHIKLYLVITTILIFMFMGLHLIHANEPNDIPQGATPISPNGPSQFHTFSFPGDIDWFLFFAEQGVTYQIFTRPQKQRSLYNLPNIVMYLFSDPTKDHIEYNKDIKIDGSAFIEWLCTNSGIYFIRVEAYEFGTYVPLEGYNIQITSIDLQEEHTIIPDVPDYSQSDFGDLWDCKAVASACILGYWDTHGYDLLVDSNLGQTENVTELVRELHEAMMDSVEKSPGKVMTDENVREGIEFFCNVPQYGNNYNFKVEYDPTRNFFKVIDEISKDRPVLYGVIGHSIWQEHWMVTVGYLKTNTTQWTINHDNWSTTHRDIYVDWDEATDCIITINPGEEPSPPPPPPPPSPPSSGPVIKIPGFNTQIFPSSFAMAGMGIFPTLGFDMSPFAGITTMPVAVWSSPSSTGNLSQFNWRGSEKTMLSTNPEGFNNQRIMAGLIRSGSFQPYEYNYRTSGYNNIFSNSTQESYFGSNLSFYSSMNVPSQNPIAFPNNPFFSTSRMLMPATGLLPYPMFSPFNSISPGLFLFGFQF